MMKRIVFFNGFGAGIVSVYVLEDVSDIWLNSILVGGGEQNPSKFLRPRPKNFRGRGRPRPKNVRGRGWPRPKNFQDVADQYMFEVHLQKGGKYYVSNLGKNMRTFIDWCDHSLICENLSQLNRDGESVMGIIMTGNVMAGCNQSLTQTR